MSAHCELTALALRHRNMLINKFIRGRVFFVEEPALPIITNLLKLVMGLRYLAQSPGISRKV